LLHGAKKCPPRLTGAGIVIWGRSPGLSAVPVIDILTHAVLFDAVSLLDFALQLVTLARNLIKVVVRELAPTAL